MDNDTIKRRVQKVVSSPVKTKKKNEVRKFADIFISEDVQSVKSYVILDVLIPAVKKAISDIVTNGVDMMLYGESGRNKKGGSSKVSYRSYYDREPERRRETSVRTSYTYDDIVFANRGDAEEALDQMYDLIERYGYVSVADLFEMADMTGQYTDNKYGWTSLRNVSVARVRDGYILKLPRALPFD